MDGGRRWPLSLFPDGVGVATVRVSLPDSLPAGTRKLGVEVTSEVDGTSRLAEIELVVPAVERATVRADPMSVTAGQTATMAISVANDGNRLIDVPIQPTDPENKVEFDFEPALFTVAPGEEVTRPGPGNGPEAVLRSGQGPRPHVQRAGRRSPTAGDRHVHPEAADLTRAARLRGAAGSRRPCSPSCSPTASPKVVDVSRVDDELLLRAIEGPDARTGPANPASIAGTVTSLTSGGGIDGVTVELFDSGSAEQTVRTTSTDSSGTFTIPRLEPGSYKVRFRGAQFAAVWYPAARDFSDGTEITRRRPARAAAASTGVWAACPGRSPGA